VTVPDSASDGEQDDGPCTVPLLDDAPEPAASILRSLTRPGRPAPSLYRALAHSPQLLKAWIDLAWPLRALTAVPRADRELAITYLGHRRRCRYIVVHHAKFAAKQGVEPGQLAALTSADPHASARTAGQRAGLRLVDSVVTDGAGSRADIAELIEHYGQQGMVEFVVTIGFYEMVSVVNRSLRIPVG
jgi:4-carboxymuconolactone decarboxylase